METLRSCIITEQGYTFISLDAIQIELKVLAILSQDPKMLEDLRTGDLHLATAIRMFGYTDDGDLMGKRRYDAKQGNFALVYDAGEERLAMMLECTVEESLEFMADHKAAYPVLYQWMDTTKAKVKEDGFTVNMFGRIRPLPELSAGSWRMRENAEREIVNTIVQGTAVDIVKLCMIQLRKDILDPSIRIVLQVHDEILLECPDIILKDTILNIIEELPLRFPDYPFSMKIGKCYGELKDVKTDIDSL
uniref:Putative DNA polymerase n=1 Tax=viral metagenome TaxID=1070528 RepID=A0A6M3LAE4_9ZZZZ